MKSDITVIPSSKPVPAALGTNPEYNYLRDLLADGRRWPAAVAAEINRLRELHLGKNQGGNRGANQHGKFIGEASFTNVKLASPQGFVAELRTETGLHPEQAKRICEAAVYQLLIDRVSAAEPGAEIDVPEKNGGTRSLKLTEAHIEQAKQAAAGMALPGAPRPSRAWAGIMGEGTRVGEYGAGKRDRAAPDHLGLWVGAAATIRRIGPQWEKLLRPGDRVRAIDELSSALAALPQHVREAIAAQAAAEAAR